ncbi:hypothetical protein L6452_24982 [Arctium lappa]|uniref:Uncharacterized protein n=1 Tax=Arctium lappa TaxID=4217 RepID=A0ACB9A9M8_ARCLA|nr:hypothetical protein L6452_24982 [Arctium lappa]
MLISCNPRVTSLPSFLHLSFFEPQSIHFNTNLADLLSLLLYFFFFLAKLQPFNQFTPSAYKNLMNAKVIVSTSSPSLPFLPKIQHF